jgi:non-ribosomal peptide synthetase component E (peptide arylation enzyme)
MEQDRLVGRTFWVYVMDGMVQYRVKSVNAKRTLARVVVDHNDPDGYRDAVLGDSAAVSYENIERLVDRDARVNRSLRAAA